MAKVPDLVEYFKLEAEYDTIDKCTIQTVEVSDKPRSRRKTRVKKKWHRVREVGRGSFGVVWLEALEDKSGEERAVKEIIKDNAMVSSGVDYYQELLALGRLSKHENLFVSFHGWYESPISLYLVMEYVELGDLANFVANPLKEIDTRLIARQLLEGLAILHEQSWAHRDLKPQNIFVIWGPPEWWIKIGDFGISKRNRDNETSWQTVVGTRDFMAPEVTQDLDEDETDSDDDNPGYTVAVDIWSLGCVLYWLLTRENPFPTRKQFVGYCRRRQGFPTSVLESHGISDVCTAFINALLMPLPSSRPTARAALEDPWIQVLDRQTLRSTPGGESMMQNCQESMPNSPKVLPVISNDNNKTVRQALTTGCLPQERRPNPSLQAPHIDSNTLLFNGSRSKPNSISGEGTNADPFYGLPLAQRNIERPWEHIDALINAKPIATSLVSSVSESPASELNIRVIEKQPSASQSTKKSEPSKDAIFDMTAPPVRQSADSPKLLKILKGLRKKSRKDIAQSGNLSEASAVFGVPLTHSIKSANVAISLTNENGESFVYGYVPVIVAKCGIFLKEKALEIENIFDTNGSEKRLRELRSLFDSPPRYGKGLDWIGYSVHDAAILLLRYFVLLPEPIIPQNDHQDFIRPLQDTKALDSPDFNSAEAIILYQSLVNKLPPLHRSTLLYMLDLLAVFADKSELNLMTAAKLAGIFVRCGFLSKGDAYLGLEERVLTFLITNQDHFLIGMRGAVADENTVADEETGTENQSDLKDLDK